MKKIFGWLLIIVCSIFLLIFAFAIIMFTVFESETPVGMTPKEIIVNAVGFVIFITLLIVGLKSGIKKIKKTEEKVDYVDTLDINVTGKIRYEDYRNLLLGLTFKRPVYLVFIIGISILLILSLINTSDIWGSNQYFILLILLGFFISPILALWQSKKNYRTNRIFQEQLNYRLTNDSIHTKGETIDAIQKWTGFYKKKETKSFFMLYHGEGVATLLDKKMFSDKELTDFRQFFQSLNLKS
ncbi:MAG: YcxB family protein [Bacteroidetes bacterium]|nr:YcxB family protein [Bacteroidota bacterium]